MGTGIEEAKEFYKGIITQIQGKTTTIRIFVEDADYLFHQRQRINGRYETMAEVLHRILLSKSISIKELEEMTPEELTDLRAELVTILDEKLRGVGEKVNG